MVKGASVREKKLGKIESADFGFGGYQDAILGFSLSFSGKNWSVNTFLGIGHIDTKNDMEMALNESGKKNLRGLIGVPVEVTFWENTIESWRILTEVI